MCIQVCIDDFLLFSQYNIEHINTFAIQNVFLPKTLTLTIF